MAGKTRRVGSLISKFFKSHRKRSPERALATAAYVSQQLESRVFLSSTGLTVITHGFALGASSFAWIEAMAQEVKNSKGGGTILHLNFEPGQLNSGETLQLAPNGETVVVYDWAGHSNDTALSSDGRGWREAAGDFLANYLLETGLANAAYEVGAPLHFIAHSFGTVVISEAIRRLGVYGIGVDQMTTLDPHDQDQSGIPDATDDPQVKVWSNIAFADNYWEDNAGDPTNRKDNFSPPILLPVGHPIDGAANRDLTKEVAPFYQNEWSYTPHSRVVGWYYKTIMGNNSSDEPELPTRNWYPTGKVRTEGFSLATPSARTNSNLDHLGMDRSLLAISKPDPTATETIFDGDFRFGSNGPTLNQPGYKDSDDPWIGNEGTVHGNVAKLTPANSSFTHRAIYIPPAAQSLSFDLDNGNFVNGVQLKITLGNSDLQTIDLTNIPTGWTTKSIPIPSSLRGYGGELRFSLQQAGPFADVWVDNLHLDLVDHTAPTINAISPQTSSIIQASTLNFDVTFSELVKPYGTGMPDATDLQLSGAGAGTAAIGKPVYLGNNSWRFPISGLTSGSFTLKIAAGAGSIQDLYGNSLAATSFTYTVSGTSSDKVRPSAALANPLNGGSIDQSTLNSRGFIHVTFSDIGSGIDPATVLDQATEFTLGGTAAQNVTLQGNPVLVSGSSSMYRYAFTGNFGLGGLLV